jgi:hypothetical protein
MGRNAAAAISTFGGEMKRSSYAKRRLEEAIASDILSQALKHDSNRFHHLRESLIIIIIIIFFFFSFEIGGGGRGGRRRRRR